MQNNKQTARLILAEAASKPCKYLVVENINETKNDVEIEEDSMTLFTVFSRNQSTLWNMIKNRTGETFELVDEKNYPDGSAQYSYKTVYDEDFGVILSNDTILKNIRCQITLPISERALDLFVKWNSCPSTCPSFFNQLLKISLAEKSQMQHY